MRKLLRRALACFRRARCCISSISSMRNICSGSTGSGLPLPWGFIEKNLNHSSERPNGFSTARHRKTKARRFHAADGGLYRLLALAGVLRKPGGAFGWPRRNIGFIRSQTLICGAVLHLVLARIRFSCAAANLVCGRDRPAGFRRCGSRRSSSSALPPRLTGFDPEVFAAPASPVLVHGPLPVSAPRRRRSLVEEIFWRGFLLRYLINEKFTEVPIGAFSWLSFAVVTVAFGFTHSPADWVAALITGALYNLVAYRTRSLTSCVIAHAVTNLLLGIWIMATGNGDFGERPGHRFCFVEGAMHATFLPKGHHLRDRGLSRGLPSRVGQDVVTGADDALNKGYKNTAPTRP